MQLVYLHSLAIQINLIWVIWFPKFTAKSLEEGIIVESCIRVPLQIKKQWMCMCIFIYTYIWASQVVLLLLSRFSCVRLVATPWTAVYQAPPSMGFSRQEYRSGVPLPSPQVMLVVKNLPANEGNARDMSSIPGLGISPGGGHGNSLQSS